MSEIVSTRKLGDGAVARPQVAGAATAATGTVSNLPAALTSATLGTLIKAMVAAQTGRGLTTLETDKGTLTLQTALPLKVGSEVVLQLQSTGVQTRVLILSVDNQPIGGGAARAAHAPPAATEAARPGLPGAEPAGARRAAAPGPGSPSATAPTPRPDLLPENRGPVTPGLVLPARVVSTGAGGAASPAPPAGGAPPPAASPAGPAVPSLVPGAALTLRVLALAPPDAEAPKPAVPPLGAESHRLAGRLLDPAPTTPGTARPILVALPEGRISLAALPPGPPGTQILFEILESRAPAAGGGALHRDFLRLGTDWQSLKEIVATLAAAGAAPAEDGAILARPGAQMASTVLFFMAALKTGDFRAWLGEARGELLAQAGQGALLGRAADDFALMARHAADAQGTGWHALAVPVAAGAHIEQFRLYYRRRGTSGRDGGEDGATHFVVEADLSRLGLFRLEGLVRPKQFDLAVHSARVLGPDMQMTIREIFTEALTSGGLAGTIRFDAGALGPFNPNGGAPVPVGQAAAVVV